jgi:hypothetical protein
MKKKRKYNTLEIVLKKFEEEQNKHPWKPVTKAQVYTKIKRDFKTKKELVGQPLFSYRTMERKIDELRDDEIIKKYWLTEVLKRNLEYQRKENKRKDKIILEQKRTQKRLLEENIATVEMAKPYLDNLRYCDSDEDWELLTNWFMKMQENKHYREEAEAWREEQESQAEVTKENPVPKLNRKEKARLKKLLK